MPDSIVEHYWAASSNQHDALRGASMDMDIDAALPKLKKQGKLHALRHISTLGRITYEALRFEGDNTIKSNVITRYLTAEAESQKQQSPDLAVTPVNYKFRYKGSIEGGGQKSYIFQVTPRKKRVGLFRGEIWIDAKTYLRVRESGQFVKSPSVFLKKIEFLREYEIKDGVSVPRHIRSTVDTRLVGKAELSVQFSNISLTEPTRRASVSDGDDINSRQNTRTSA